MALNPEYKKEEWRFIAKEQREGGQRMENHHEEHQGEGILLTWPNRILAKNWLGKLRTGRGPRSEFRGGLRGTYGESSFHLMTFCSRPKDGHHFFFFLIPMVRKTFKADNEVISQWAEQPNSSKHGPQASWPNLWHPEASLKWQEWN